MKRFAKTVILLSGLILLLAVCVLTIARFNPSNNYWLAFVANPGERNEIFRVRSDGTHLEQLTDNTIEEFNPIWSPQGAWIAYLSVYYPGYNDLTIMRHDGTQSHHITERAAPISDPLWLENPGWIAYTGIQQSERRVFKMDVKTGTNVVLIHERLPVSLYSAPILSPDSEWVALRLQEEASTRLMVARNDGSEMVLLAENIDGKPSWSPDSQWLTFASKWQIFRVRRDGSLLIPLTGVETVASSPAWSPDGKWIAFSTFGEMRWDIYKMQPDGSNLQVITNLPIAETDPDWSPEIGLPWNGWIMLAFLVGIIILRFVLTLTGTTGYIRLHLKPSISQWHMLPK